jgi:hypothetical protein
MPTGKEVADKWFDQFGPGMQQRRVELASMIDEALRVARIIERERRVSHAVKMAAAYNRQVGKQNTETASAMRCVAQSIRDHLPA